MPRITASDADCYDFCITCWENLYPTEEQAREVFAEMGDGPDGRGNCFGYDDEHPDYGDTDCCCDACDRRLTDRDNYA